MFSINLAMFSSLLLSSGLPAASITNQEVCIENIVKTCLNPEDFIVQVNFGAVFSFAVVRYDPRDYLHEFIIRKPDAYIIFVDSASELDTLEYMFMDIAHFNPRAKFIFPHNKPSKEFLQMLKRFYVYQVVLLQTINTNTTVLYSYTPYDQNRLVVVGRCTESKLQVDSELFKYTLPNDWSKFTLTVLYAQYPPYVIDVNSTDNRGIEINLIHMVSTHLRMNFKYIPSVYTYWGEIENGNFTEAWGELKTRKYDLAIGWFHLKFNEFLYFDTSVGYLQDAVKFIAPKAMLRKDNVMTLLRAFELKVWLIYFVSLLIFFLIFHVTRKYCSNCSNLLTVTDDVLFLIRIMVETGVSFDKKIKSIHFFLTLCIFFVFYVNAAFKSKLLVLFSEKKFEHQINTLEDIVQSGIGIGYHPYFNSSFAGYESDVEKHIYENSFQCGFDWNCVQRIATRRDMVTIQTAGPLKYLAPRDYVDEEGRALIHITDTVVRLFPGHAFFVKGSPLFPRINRYLTILMENGFVRFHYRKIDHENEITLQKAAYKHTKLLRKSLGLQKLMGAFYFFFGGVFMSVVVFLAEVLYFRSCSRG